MRRDIGLSLKTWRCEYCGEKWGLAHDSGNRYWVLIAAAIHLEWAEHSMDCCTVRVIKALGFNVHVKEISE